MQKKVTLKDIAETMGVTSTTIHRALKGKEGVSDEMRKEVQKVAARMGYRSNYMAAALKRKELRIAFVLPEPTGDNRFYYGNLWFGVKRFLQDIESDFQITAIEHTYSFSYGANGIALKNIFEQHSNDLDGLITMGVDQGQSSYYIKKFAEKNIPIVFVGDDLYKESVFCCVQSYNAMAGSLAAELLTTFNVDKTPKKAIVIGHFGQLGMSDQIYNAKGFDDYIKENTQNISTIHVREEQSNNLKTQVSKLLLDNKDIFAMYSCSARYTVYMSRLIQELKLTGSIKLIGNDCFTESIELLESGVLSAIIDKKIARQSYIAVRTLFDYIIKNEYPHSNILQVRPEVVLRSNVDKDLITGGLKEAGKQNTAYDDIVAT